MKIISKDLAFEVLDEKELPGLFIGPLPTSLQIHVDDEDVALIVYFGLERTILGAIRVEEESVEEGFLEYIQAPIETFTYTSLGEFLHLLKISFEGGKFRFNRDWSKVEFRPAIPIGELGPQFEIPLPPPEGPIN